MTVPMNVVPMKTGIYLVEQSSIQNPGSVPAGLGPVVDVVSFEASPNPGPLSQPATLATSRSPD